MQENYHVILGNKQVGKVRIIKQGLYYRLICRFYATCSEVYHLYAIIDERQEKIGVPVLDGEGFVLDKMIPFKRLAGENLKFVLSSASVMRDLPGEFVPIFPEEPFQYIEHLKSAFLATEYGKIGVYIKETPETV